MASAAVCRCGMLGINGELVLIEGCGFDEICRYVGG